MMHCRRPNLNPTPSLTLPHLPTLTLHRALSLDRWRVASEPKGTVPAASNKKTGLPGFLRAGRLRNRVVGFWGTEDFCLLALDAGNHATATEAGRGVCRGFRGHGDGVARGGSTGRSTTTAAALATALVFAAATMALEDVQQAVVAAFLAALRLAARLGFAAALRLTAALGFAATSLVAAMLLAALGFAAALRLATACFGFAAALGFATAGLVAAMLLAALRLAAGLGFATALGFAATLLLTARLLAATNFLAALRLASALRLATALGFAAAASAQHRIQQFETVRLLSGAQAGAHYERANNHAPFHRTTSPFRPNRGYVAPRSCAFYRKASVALSGVAFALRPLRRLSWMWRATGRCVDGSASRGGVEPWFFGGESRLGRFEPFLSSNDPQRLSVLRNLSLAHLRSCASLASDTYRIGRDLNTP